MTPRYAPQFGSRLHFKRGQALPKETPFFGDPFFGTPCFLFFCFFLALQRLARLKCNLEPNCGAYLGVIILQPHACTQRFRLRILRRTRSNAGRTSARSLSGRIESIWETPSKERARVLGIFELARKASDFHKRAVQLLIEKLDVAALASARPQAARLREAAWGRPLGHLSSRKAGVVRPRGGLFQKPCLHASEALLLQKPCLHALEGRRESHFEQLRRIESRESEKNERARDLFCLRVLELICALARGSCRGATRWRRIPLLRSSSSTRSLSLALSVDKIVKAVHPPAEISVLALPLHTAQSFCRGAPNRAA